MVCLLLFVNVGNKQKIGAICHFLSHALVHGVALVPLHHENIDPRFETSVTSFKHANFLKIHGERNAIEPQIVANPFLSAS